jgi:hypothetical protein
MDLDLNASNPVYKATRGIIGVQSGPCDCIKNCWHFMFAPKNGVRSTLAEAAQNG